MRRRGFTLIELLVVVSIIALLLGILLPAISNAVDQAKKTQSMTNLKNIGTAMGSYSADWAGRQYTLIDDSIASYGNTLESAFSAYNQALQSGQGEAGQHPGPRMGWGYLDGNGDYILFMYRCDGNLANASLCVPINIVGGIGADFGSFRLINCSQFNQYVSGRFYDPVFYAPKDTIVIDDVEGGETGYSCFNSPGEFCDRPAGSSGDIPSWSSYVLSPAAMFAPNVMSHNGFTNYWELAGGLRSPSMSQAKFPSLKTHVMEHHWLQNRATECNPAFEPGTYSGCEPYYFNHATDSIPNALFYDGHVEPVGVQQAQRADARNQGQAGWGLWNRTTTYGQGGYFHSAAYEEDANTSFHILTSDGIRGRDIVAE